MSLKGTTQLLKDLELIVEDLEYLLHDLNDKDYIPTKKMDRKTPKALALGPTQEMIKANNKMNATRSSGPLQEESERLLQDLALTKEEIEENNKIMNTTRSGKSYR
jgi:hypothetical protein